ncbi:MAG: NADH:ubiquinone reductase (Na(+)-transporting) subunit C [Flavobacteriales bacterium]|nr:NADH:ubiquinone reductase (Na(+)-transporting) subunit C [Flavobacteriales bacterium]
MKFDKEGNGFTFGFATVMVVIVATLLSVASIGLKPFQQKNKTAEKMQNILKTIGVEVSRDEATKVFGNYVKQRIILDFSANPGVPKEGAIDPLDKEDAFNVDMKKQYKGKSWEDRSYPLYVCEKDGQQYLVIPMVGTGLWGPIWGFIALEGDNNTVFGASFDHKTETPGLGAEINTAEFQEQFEGQKLFDEEGNFISIKVMKGGAPDNFEHGVDAITGGTITSNGVTAMLKNTLEVYQPYLQQ